MKNFVDLSCTEFADVLASKAAVPGGGSAAAMAGALGVALGSMVGNLTVGRKKYAAYEDDLKRMIADGEEIRSRLLALVQADGDNYEPMMAAYAIPKDDPSRPEAIKKVTIDACSAPMEMMRWTCKAIDLLEEMLEKGSVTLVSDTGCGALCCYAALRSAAMNIFVNTKSLADREIAGKLDGEANEMIRVYGAKASKIADEVDSRLRV